MSPSKVPTIQARRLCPEQQDAGERHAPKVRRTEQREAAEAPPAESSLPAAGAPAQRPSEGRGAVLLAAAVPLANWAAEAVGPGAASLQMLRCP